MPSARPPPADAAGRTIPGWRCSRRPAPPRRTAAVRPSPGPARRRGKGGGGQHRREGRQRADAGGRQPDEFPRADSRRHRRQRRQPKPAQPDRPQHDGQRRRRRQQTQLQLHPNPIRQFSIRNYQLSIGGWGLPSIRPASPSRLAALPDLMPGGVIPPPPSFRRRPESSTPVARRRHSAPPTVIPAEAGIQHPGRPAASFCPHRRSGGGRNPVPRSPGGIIRPHRHSGGGRNPAPRSPGGVIPPPPSFPRKRESTHGLSSRLGRPGCWIPASAGMTVGVALLAGAAWVFDGRVGGRGRFSLTPPSPAGRGWGEAALSGRGRGFIGVVCNPP